MPGTPFKPASNIENPSFLREYIKTIHDTIKSVNDVTTELRKEVAGKHNKQEEKLEALQKEMHEMSKCMHKLHEKLSDYPEVKQMVRNNYTLLKVYTTIASLWGGVIGFVTSKFFGG